MRADYHDYYKVCAGIPEPHMDWFMITFLTLVIWTTRSALWGSFLKFSVAILRVPDPGQELLEKMSKYVWHCLYYVITTIWCAVLIYYSPFGFSLKRTVMEGCHDPDLGPTHFFFFLQIAWYIHGFFEIVLYDANRKDYWLMILHHFLSIVLIYGSMKVYLHRIGLVVMLEQDLSDVSLYLARVMQKCTSDPETGKPRNLQCQRYHTLGIILMSVMWFLCRKVVLFGIVVRCAHHIYHNGFFHMPYWRQSLAFFLLALLVMQVVWGLALFRMCYEQIRKGAWTEHYFDVAKKRSSSPRGRRKAQ